MKHILLLICYLACCSSLLGQTRSGTDYGMVAGSVAIDNAEAFQAAINDHLKGKLSVLVLDGVFNFDSPIQLNGANGLRIQGPDNAMATFFTDNLYSILVNTASTKNVTLKNLKFEATTAADEKDKKGNENALLFITRAKSASNWLIENCEFTAPNALINGIKVYVENENLVHNISIRNSKFYDLGRMGAETVNHDKPKKIERIKNIIFEGNTVMRTGRIRYGMGLSLSGRNADCLIQNNNFHDNPNCAIEIVGNSNTDILNNTMRGKGSAVHITDGSGIYADDVYLKCNDADVTEGNVYILAKNILSENNTWFSQTKNYILGVDGFVTNNDHIKAAQLAVFQIFGSPKTKTQNIRFDNSVLEATAKIPIVSYNRSKGDIATIQINCSEVRIPKGNNFGQINFANTKCFVNDKLSSIANEANNSCLTKVFR